MEIQTAARSRKTRLLASNPLFPVALAILIALSVAGPPVTPPASALPADIGPLKGRLDTTASAGVSVRVEERDAALVGQTNGGQAASCNSDDGNLNFDPWDITSLNVKVLHEGEWKWNNYSFFGRFYYFYDWAIMKFDPDFRAFTDQAERRAGMDIRLLDAFLVGSYEVFSRPLTVRVGNQVLSWGESTFIQNGINSINPVDVTALRVAGAELKEALLPVPMISFSTDLAGSLSFEGFYQFYWDNTEVEPLGTYFSSTDIASPGAYKAMLGFGLAPPYGPTDNPDQAVGTRPPFGSQIPRMADNEAQHMGQGGLALRYFAGWLRDSELGLYWEHIHSRTPLLSGMTGNAPPEDTLDLILWGLLNGDYASGGGYFREFPEDIDVVGASFNTQAPYGIALQGEVTGRLNQPLQVDDVELLFGAYSPLDPTLIILRGLPEGSQIFRQSQLIQDQGEVGFNEYLRGWKRKDIMQAQATATKVWGPTLGTDQIVFLCELGATWVLDMEDESELRYEAPGTFTSGNSYFSAAGIQPYTTPESAFADSFSWGYRLATRLDFYNAVGPVTVQPVFAWYHDVEGTTPSPVSNFIEGRKQMTVGFNFDYLNMLKAGISYTMYFGAGQLNPIHDRDFLSFSTSLSF